MKCKYCGHKHTIDTITAKMIVDAVLREDNADANSKEAEG